MRSCSTVNIPLAIKIKPQMVVEYQLHKKLKEQELAKIEAEQRASALAEKEQEALISDESEDVKEDP